MNMNIGANVRRVRLAAGMTQAELGRRAKFHPVQLSDLERGRHLPSIPVLLRLAKVLKVPASKLLGEK